MENQGISNDLPNPDGVIGPQTGNIAANIAAKPIVCPPPSTNQPHGSLHLPITVHPQKERIDSMEKQGQPATSSSSNTSEKSTEKSTKKSAENTAAIAPAAAQSKGRSHYQTRKPARVKEPGQVAYE